VQSGGVGPQTEIEYRLAWARTYLKGMGLLTNSKRGVWTLTEDGTALLTDPGPDDNDRRKRIRQLHAKYVTDVRNVRQVEDITVDTSFFTEV
jgi:restriction system protein